MHAGVVGHHIKCCPLSDHEAPCWLPPGQWALAACFAVPESSVSRPAFETVEAIGGGQQPGRLVAGAPPETVRADPISARDPSAKRRPLVGVLPGVRSASGRGGIRPRSPAPAGRPGRRWVITKPGEIVRSGDSPINQLADPRLWPDLMRRICGTRVLAGSKGLPRCPAIGTRHQDPWPPRLNEHQAQQPP